MGADIDEKDLPGQLVHSKSGSGGRVLATMYVRRKEAGQLQRRPGLR
jgi:hypothetical protein